MGRRKLKLLKWLNAWCSAILIAVIFGFAILTGLYSLHLTASYEETAYDDEHYADSIQFMAALTEADAECNKDQKKRQFGYCKVFSDLVKDRAALHDLGAQETMALATRGLLPIGMLQTWALFLTLGFLVLAVIQTHRMLREARAATIATEQTTAIARDTYKEAMKSNIAQLKSYVSVVEARVTHYTKMIDEKGKEDDWYYGMGFVVVFQNIGQSPAEILTGSILKSDFKIGFANSKGNEIIATDACLSPTSLVTSILNPNEKQSYTVFGEIPRSSEFVSYFRRKEELIFDFYGSIEFKDNFTPARKIRVCAFRVRRWVESAAMDGGLMSWRMKPVSLAIPWWMRTCKSSWKMNTEKKRVIHSEVKHISVEAKASWIASPTLCVIDT